MPEIDFGLLQPVNVGALTQQGFSTGMAMVKQVQTKNALRAYLSNPDDPQAYNALAAFDPATASQLLTQRQEQARLAAAQRQIATRQTAGTQAAGGDVQGGMKTALSGGDTEFADALSKLDDNKKKQLVDMYKGAAPLAYQALKLPYEQRKSYVQQIAPQLEAAGWTPDKISAFDPTDANLGAIVQGNMSLEQAISRDKIDYREVLPGARLVPFDANGRPITGDHGSDVQGPPAAPAKANSGGFGNAVAFTLKHEGGYAPNDANGQPVNMGINQGANPDVDVKNLTPAQATQIYHDRYWVPSGAESLPAQIQTPYFDTYVLNPKKAKQFLAESGGDPNRFLDLRQSWLSSLAGHPGHAKYAEAWKTRTDALRAQSGGQDVAAIRQHAQEAISAGADPAQVKARAKAMGVDL